MNEEKEQLDLGNESAPQQGELSDDDIAATLGFATTLHEGMMTPPEDPTDLQEDSDGEQEDIEGETDGTPKKDADQDKRIAEIEAQLQQLLAEETNEQDTENTGTEA